ncbi:GNAT family N-acetyltransferase [Streptomyces oceani]|uniref:GCN5 family acetyltransferase n=1 Tax=Streptomyces oceani TaxID=1075402 RepID=A0A1E7KMQ6_9ACTN|nr:GNAT family N-acetyltransferase [Streptomyces oceani]OEV05176.1 GCN5 family acetyltransferase [Streptomyces oceani]
MTDSAEVQVSDGTEGDLEELTDLYNHYVRVSPVTFDIEPFTPAERRPWLLSHSGDGPHRLLVARRTGSVVPGRLLGYAHSGRFRPKPAYDTSVECSVYVAPRAAGQGTGTLLYKQLFERLDGLDLHRAYAGITVPNEPSVRLHQRFGFELCGTYHEAGRKFGRFHDVERFEKPL